MAHLVFRPAAANEGTGHQVRGVFDGRLMLLVRLLDGSIERVLIGVGQPIRHDRYDPTTALSQAMPGGAQAPLPTCFAARRYLADVRQDADTYAFFRVFWLIRQTEC